MERQVRLTAGAVVLTGLALGRLRPAFRLASVGIAGGLVVSALTNTCTMAALLAKLPHNLPHQDDFAAPSPPFATTDITRSDTPWGTMNREHTMPGGNR